MKTNQEECGGQGRRTNPDRQRAKYQYDRCRCKPRTLKSVSHRTKRESAGRTRRLQRSGWRQANAAIEANGMTGVARQNRRGKKLCDLHPEKPKSPPPLIDDRNTSKHERKLEKEHDGTEVKNKPRKLSLGIHCVSPEIVGSPPGDPVSCQDSKWLAVQ